MSKEIKIHPETRKILKEAIEIDDARRKDGTIMYHGSLLFKILRTCKFKKEGK